LLAALERLDASQATIRAGVAVLWNPPHDPPLLLELRRRENEWRSRRVVRRLGAMYHVLPRPSDEVLRQQARAVLEAKR
jgi:hypothetical protein